MYIIKDSFDFTVNHGTVITLGKFDGVHRGHQALIGRVKAYAASHKSLGRSPKTVVFTFMMNHYTLLTVEERREIIGNMGIDILVECPFVPMIITMEAEDFVRKILVEQMQVCHLVVGEDFRFGYGRRGDVAMLRELGRRYDFTVEVVDKVTDEEGRISSSRVRRRIGRAIGFPTTNLIPDGSKLLPPNGVYFVRTRIGGRDYNGVTNIGTKPTVDGHFLGVETYLYDCDDGTDLYGQKQRVELLHFSRPEKKFSNIDDLKAQIAMDRENGAVYFGR